jgi:hypothetical protein
VIIIICRMKGENRKTTIVTDKHEVAKANRDVHNKHGGNVHTASSWMLGTYQVIVPVKEELFRAVPGPGCGSRAVPRSIAA